MSIPAVTIDFKGHVVNVSPSDTDLELALSLDQAKDYVRMKFPQEFAGLNEEVPVCLIYSRL